MKFAKIEIQLSLVVFLFVVMVWPFFDGAFLASASGQSEANSIGSIIRRSNFLIDPEMHKYLELSKKQKEEFHQIRQETMKDLLEFSQRQKRIWKKVRLGSEKEKLEALDSFQKSAEQSFQKTQSKINAALTKPQRLRLAGIKARIIAESGGVDVMLQDKRVLKSLGISGKEAEKLRQELLKLRSKRKEELKRVNELFDRKLFRLLPPEKREIVEKWMKLDVPGLSRFTR